MRTSGDFVRAVVDARGEEHPVSESGDWLDVSPGVAVRTQTGSSRTGAMSQITTETTLRIQRSAAPITVHIDDVYDYRLGERTSYEKKSRAVMVQADDSP